MFYLEFNSDCRLKSRYPRERKAYQIVKKRLKNKQMLSDKYIIYIYSNSYYAVRFKS